MMTFASIQIWMKRFFVRWKFMITTKGLRLTFIILGGKKSAIALIRNLGGKTQFGASRETISLSLSLSLEVDSS